MRVSAAHNALLDKQSERPHGGRGAAATATDLHLVCGHARQPSWLGALHTAKQRCLAKQRRLFCKLGRRAHASHTRQSRICLLRRTRCWMKKAPAQRAAWARPAMRCLCVGLPLRRGARRRAATPRTRCAYDVVAFPTKEGCQDACGETKSFNWPQASCARASCKCHHAFVCCSSAACVGDM